MHEQATVPSHPNLAPDIRYSIEDAITNPAKFIPHFASDDLRNEDSRKAWAVMAVVAPELARRDRDIAALRTKLQWATEDLEEYRKFEASVRNALHTLNDSTSDGE